LLLFPKDRHEFDQQEDIYNRYNQPRIAHFQYCRKQLNKHNIFEYQAAKMGLSKLSVSLLALASSAIGADLPSITAKVSHFSVSRCFSHGARRSWRDDQLGNNR
jgi:hypothetical protein